MKNLIIFSNIFIIFLENIDTNLFFFHHYFFEISLKIILKKKYILILCAHLMHGSLTKILKLKI